MDPLQNSAGNKHLSRKTQALIASTIIVAILSGTAALLAAAIHRSRLQLREVRAAHPDVQQIVTSEDQRADYYIITLTNRDGSKSITKHDGYIGSDELKLKQLANDVFAKYPDAQNFSIEQKVTRWHTVVARNNDGTLSVIRIDQD